LTVPRLHPYTRPDPPESHHRTIQGGAARAAVLGVSDGLVTNVSLILGVAGANISPGTVRLTGLAGTYLLMVLVLLFRPRGLFGEEGMMS